MQSSLVEHDVLREGDLALDVIDVAAKDHLIGRPEVGPNLSVRQATSDAWFEYGVECLVNQREGIGDRSVEIEYDRGKSGHGATLSFSDDRFGRTRLD